MNDPYKQKRLEAEQREYDAKNPNREERRDNDERRTDTRRMDDKAMEEVKKLPTTDLSELRALATTIRNCQRNGHPDAGKHIEALLTKLGA